MLEKKCKIVCSLECFFKKVIMWFCRHFHSEIWTTFNFQLYAQKSKSVPTCLGKRLSGTQGVLGDHFGPTTMDWGRFGRKIFLTFFAFFSSIFEAILAWFWRFSHMKSSTNEIFSKLSLVSQIRMTESWIWSHTLLP